MVEFYLTQNEKLEKLDRIQSGCWISMISPTEQEIQDISEKFDIDNDIIRAALDIDERSRIDTDQGCIMVLVNIPTLEEKSDNELYSTIPMSIIRVRDVIITVCSEDSPIIRNFSQGKVKGFNTNMKSRFILQFLNHIATFYLQYLRNIDKKSDAVETQLQKSTQNHELIELLKLEKSLVYFTTALRSNEMVLEKLLRNDLIKKYPEDAELLEDVIVENKQAIEMANIYSGILSGMMDAFASVISNNLNIVMKFLAIITIVMAIPTMIFSAYGMNVDMSGMPFAQSHFGFPIIITSTVLISIIVVLIFFKFKMFK